MGLPLPLLLLLVYREFSFSKLVVYLFKELSYEVEFSYLSAVERYDVYACQRIGEFFSPRVLDMGLCAVPFSRVIFHRNVYFRPEQIWCEVPAPDDARCFVRCGDTRIELRCGYPKSSKGAWKVYKHRESCHFGGCGVG